MSRTKPGTLIDDDDCRLPQCLTRAGPVPCANCVRRECADICPRQTLGSLKSMRRRVSLLEQAQQSPSSTAHRGRDRDRDGTRASEATTAASGEPRQAPDAAARAAAQPDLLECADNTGEAAGVGTLVVDSDGRSKFIGHAASFQWLRDVRRLHFSPVVLPTPSSDWQPPLSLTGDKGKPRDASRIPDTSPSLRRLPLSDSRPR